MLIPRLFDFPAGEFGGVNDLRGDERAYPYPGERPIVVMRIDELSLRDSSARACCGTQYSVSSSDTHDVRVQECLSHFVDWTRPGQGAPANLNEILADIVHWADNSLKSLKSPVWSTWLKRTASLDAHGKTGMLVMIDKVRSAAVSQGDCHHDVKVVIRMDSPRIKKLAGVRRCVWVESISLSVHVSPAREGSSCSDLRVRLRDDRIEEKDLRDDPLERHLRRNHQEDLARGWAEYEHAKIRASKDTAEVAALESLRESLTEGEWRRYLKRGFVLVRGASGREYQIFRDRWHTKVRERGKVVAEVCSRLPSNVPPTDNVIAFKTMIECDEAQFERAGNVYRMAAG